MNDKKSMIEFPCDFPLKIVGKKTANFATDIIEIIHKHFPETPDKAIRHQESQHGNYLAITAVVHAQDQVTLDALYRDLTKHPDIKMVL
ncbi:MULTISPECIES: YbeD family protein [Legionella]|uniref:UPF0250 protein NCTC13292_01544 n=2 Tax=Legionella donaldsonii TaxID=45060 RepID=A0A378J4H5_9GAMM|nr:DUF493 domain-containing protein [Legionella donaldsonii]STX42399.1 putative lipoate regulatory protein YbeD [Legionella donaldsonii]